MKKLFLFITLLLTAQAGFCKQLLIATYNTKLLPIPVLLHDLPAKQITYTPAKRAFQIAQQFANHDIVSFQEVMNIADNYALAHAMEQQGFHYSTLRPGESWRNLFKGYLLSGGVRIFSKHPITKTDYTIFPRSCHAEQFTAKGAVYAHIITSTGKPIHLFSLHAQSSREETNDEALEHLLSSKRTEQFKSLKDFIDQQWVPEGETILLSGDFNVDNGAITKGIENNMEPHDEFDEMLTILSATPAGNYHETSLPYSHDTKTNPLTLAVYPMGLRANLDHILSVKETNGWITHPLLDQSKTKVEL